MPRILCALVLSTFAAACNGDTSSVDASGGGDGGADGSTSAGTSMGESTADDATAGQDCENIDPVSLECVCSQGTHDCDGQCVEDDSIDHCGAACSPCPTADNAAATCIDGVCELECDDGFVSCNEGCCLGDSTVIWGNTTTNTSMTLDAANVPHVSFLANIGNLSYAHLTPSGWEVEAIGGEGAQISSTAIALDGNGEPRIAYRGTQGIRLAQRNDGTWTDELVFESQSVTGPTVGPRAFEIDSEGVPHLVVVEGQESLSSITSTIFHVARDGEAWVREELLTEENRFSSPTMTIGADNALHVAWMDSYENGLHYATRNADAWTHEVVLDNAGCCDQVIIALGPNATPSIAYKSVDLNYNVATAGTPWSFETLHNPVGRAGDIAFNTAGDLVYSLTDGELYLGRPTGSGWDESVIFPDVPSFLMALDDEDAAHFVVRGSNDSLQYAYEPAP